MRKPQQYGRLSFSLLLLLYSSGPHDLSAWINHVQRPDNVRPPALRPVLTPPRRSSLSASASDANEDEASPRLWFDHTLAILAMPSTTLDHIANEAILQTALAKSKKLSVVVRCDAGGSSPQPSLASLRRYVGEIYSALWDSTVPRLSQAEEAPEDSSLGEPEPILVPDVVVYPQNLPNTAPESWIDIQPDLDAVCTLDALCGWISEEATGRGTLFQSTGGKGGLLEHVAALNQERKSRQLHPVVALPVSYWEEEAGRVHANQQVVFMEDEPGQQSFLKQAVVDPAAGEEQQEFGSNSGSSSSSGMESFFLGGPQINARDATFDSVAVGGTFDGLHYGHRKLLTLAVSSVTPVSGRLLVGVTVDDMLRKKKYAAYIPPLEERMNQVRLFLRRLAPGMMNRVKLVPIQDAYGPVGEPNQKPGQYEALVLSHETLATGHALNGYRKDVLNLPPLQLLCTRRTEAHGMSSTALRRLRFQHNQQVPAQHQATSEIPPV